MNMHNLPAMQRSIPDVISEYFERLESVDNMIEDLGVASRALEVGSVVAGTYVGSIWGRYGSVSVHKRDIEKNLLKSAWKHIYDGLNIAIIAPVKDRSAFERMMEDPPELTIENLRDKFGEYIKNPREHILRGLAEQFTNLDPAYKSHDRVKIGVSGLPKRIVVGYVTDDYGLSYDGKRKMMDVINALFTYLSEPLIENAEVADWGKKAWSSKSADHRGMTLKLFKNGNAHLHFSDHRLDAINRALAEFYGDVLPDSPEENVKKRASTAVSKDLQFYPTPDPVTQRILSDIHIKSDMLILEPSCGEGAMMMAVKKQNPEAKIVGIEYDAGRVQKCRDKGLAVVQGNFLNVPPKAMYDLVVMNPPFAGLHWKKHLLLAMQMVKSDGQIACVLPASAYVDGHLDDIKDKVRSFRWTDLPTGSFRDSGTNIATGFVRFWTK